MVRLFLVFVLIIALVVIMFFARVRADGVELRIPVMLSDGSCDKYMFAEWTTRGWRSGRDSLVT